MKLKSYDKIPSEATRNLLIGNGFSIGVSRQFSYTSLKQVCVDNNWLSNDENQLFEKLAYDNNFEFILNQLRTAADVNQILDINHKKPSSCYKNIRDALIKSIRLIHPDFSNIGKNWKFECLEELSRHESIFTTNYDLLTYWITAKSNFGHFNKDRKFSRFTDCFWSSNLVFDPFNTDIWGKKTPVYYLHGALFLYRDKVSQEVTKIRSKDRRNLLDSIENIWQDGHSPVLISEGSAKAKKIAIQTDPYLTFAFSRFLKIRGGMTIFGHSLSETSDGHIVSGVSENKNLSHLAISIYPGTKSDDEIEDQMERISYSFRKFRKRGGKIIFYDSTTCPLSYFSDS